MVVCTGQVWDVELGTCGSGRFVSLLPRVAEDHHNSHVGKAFQSMQKPRAGPPAHAPESQKVEAGKHLVWVFRNPKKTNPLLHHGRGTSKNGLRTWGWGDGGMGSRARRGAQPEPALSRWQPQGFHRFPWILFSTPRLKISPQGKMERKLCGRLCYVSSWIFP